LIRLAAVLVLLVLVSSALAVPAYSLLPDRDSLLSGVAESRPLTALPGQPAGSDLVNLYGHMVPKSAIRTDFGAINLGELKYNGNIARTLVMGSGDSGALADAYVMGLGGDPKQGPFLGVAFSESPLGSGGFSYASDMPLAFDSVAQLEPGRLSGSSIIGSDSVVDRYGVTGKGVTVAIVDTGTDFSNNDMQHAVARDENNVPIMIDADGQGLVLTKAKYVAKINQKSGQVMNYTDNWKKPQLSENVTSYVYTNSTGVYLRISYGRIPVYNSLYPVFGSPVLSASANVDWKIGDGPYDFIQSKSGMYHLGAAYLASTQYGGISLTLMPVLVVDSTKPGVYDTIIPDMSYGWYYFLLSISGSQRQTNYLIPEQPTFDFTDERPIKIGDGNEFLTYDYNRDNAVDFSVGTAGARVVDIWRVTDNSTETYTADDRGFGGVVTAKLLEPMDPEGNYFGVMYDFAGHGTATAATAASAGKEEYAVYNNSTKYKLAGMAPDAKIIPVKSLWSGGVLYGWLWASGFELVDGRWNYTGNHKADIVSNSWGVSNFPLLGSGPGYDVLSVFSSLLVVPDVLHKNYPGTVFVNSVGNNGIGYGSVGSPNTSPFAISVGATTNNVHLQYGPFANITRFGSSTAAYDDVAEFSSRGPSLIGDVKPELMAVGSYGFVPADVTVKNLGSKKGDSNDDGAFVLFGGTSMAAPMVAGAAALVVQELKDSGREVNPFEVKSILMSSAKDLSNDPFVQGSGRVDALAAIELARGDSDRFSIHTEDTAENLLSTLAPAVSAYADTLGIINSGYLLPITRTLPHIDGYRPESRWFAGYVEQGKTAEGDIVVHNPTSKTLHVQLSSTVEKLVARYEMTNATRLFETDPTHKDDDYGYAPNYYDLTRITGEIPDTDLMVARVNFPFSSFMNTTELFADRLRIVSLYAYDWNDADGDGKVTYAETTMINRGGAWGTTQEMRVADPQAKFAGTPVIGIYPVPDVYSFWRGDTRIDAAPMNYTLTVEFYKRTPNPDITLDKDSLTILPRGNGTVHAIITVDSDAISGIHYGEIMAETSDHVALMPVSYAVTTAPVPKDVPVVISPGTKHGPAIEKDLGLKPNGYVGGLSDMTSRYAAGDWRPYYFNVTDPTITSMSLKISWPHNSTSINAMAFGPDGALAASSVPAGVFQEFANWPSNDWLGTSTFSEGGAFYFSQNAGPSATVLHVPVEKTGVYSLLVHNTLFHGQSLYEPVSVEAKFSTLVPDSKPPVITADFPQFVPGGKSRVTVTLEDENPAGLSYAVDGSPEPAVDKGWITIDGGVLGEGIHTLVIESTDAAGNSALVSSQFMVDRTLPIAQLYITEGNSTRVADGTVAIAGAPTLSWNVTDANGVRTPAIVTLPEGRQSMLNPSHSTLFNTTALADGRYNMTILSRDVPGNRAVQTWEIIVDNTAPNASVAVDGGDVRGTTTIAFEAEDENPGQAALLIGDRMEVNVTGLSEYALDTTGLPDGQYEVKLAATDAAGNPDTAVAMLTVANVKPTIEMVAVLGVAGGLAAGAGIAWVIARRRS
jgi:hypothetical protein